MQGKRVLITGGNSGIGLVSSMELARMGAEVVLACRDTDKTATALEQINTAADIPAVNLPVELASLQSVRDLGAAFLDRYDRLDVLINNAGIYPAKQRFTEEGFEMQIGVNHLSHFLLTNLLLDCIKQSAPARIITVTSMLHKRGRLDFDTFKGFTKYSAQTAYNQSKLANVLFGVELAERLRGSGVTSNVLHPGGVNTDIVREAPWLLRKLLSLIFISPEKGAETTIMLASDPQLAETTGKYYNQCKLDDYAPVADDAELRRRLWDVSADAVGLPA